MGLELSPRVLKEETYRFSGRGKIYSFAPVKEAPTGFEEQAPYTVALIRLDEGPLVTAQLTDFGDLEPKIEMPVEEVTRKLKVAGDPKRGLIIYGHKFRPVLWPQPEPASG